MFHGSLVGDVINLPSKIGANIEADATHVPRWHEKFPHIMGLSGETRTGPRCWGMAPVKTEACGFEERMCGSAYAGKDSHLQGRPKLGIIPMWYPQ